MYWISCGATVKVDGDHGFKSGRVTIDTMLDRTMVSKIFSCSRSFAELEPSGIRRRRDGMNTLTIPWRQLSHSETLWLRRIWKLQPNSCNRSHLVGVKKIAKHQNLWKTQWLRVFPFESFSTVSTSTKSLVAETG